MVSKLFSEARRQKQVISAYLSANAEMGGKRINKALLNEFKYAALQNDVRIHGMDDEGPFFRRQVVPFLLKPERRDR